FLSLPPRAQTMVEDGIEKTLCFARTRSSCDNGWLGLMILAGQAPPCARLMFEWMKGNFEIKRKGFIRIRRTERAAQLRPRPFEQSSVRVSQEPLESLINLPVAEIKG